MNEPLLPRARSLGLGQHVRIVILICPITIGFVVHSAVGDVLLGEVASRE